MVYFRRLVSDLDPGAVDGPSEVGTDNKGARDVAYNPEHHGRMKHVERRHFFVRDMVEKFEIRVPWIEGEGNVSDFLTKPLTSSARFFKLRDEIMNVCGHRPPTSCAVPVLCERPRAREIQSRIISFMLRAAGLPLSTSQGLNRGAGVAARGLLPHSCVSFFPSSAE